MIRAIKSALQSFKKWLRQLAFRHQATPGDDNAEPSTGSPESDQQATPAPEADTQDSSGGLRASLDGEESADDEKPPPRSESPIDAGGRRHGKPSPNTEPGTPPRPKAGGSRPELICRKPLGSWSWHVALLIDGERQVKEVRHHGALLKAGRGVVPLASYSGALSVVFEDGDEHRLPLFDGAPLIFKLKEKWRGDGRRVAHITKGHFIVIAPKDWERIGDKPVAPKNCADPDFTAHYFYQDGSGTDVGGFRQCGIALSGSNLELLGQRVFDDSEDGDLFVGAAPELKTSREVAHARVGEEAKGGWDGENFKPAERFLADVLGGRQGRFFVRVYDESVQRVASSQFRYLRHLKAIYVDDKPYTEDTYTQTDRGWVFTDKGSVCRRRGQPD